MKHLRSIGGMILVCVVAAAATSAAPLTVPAGMTVSVRMLDSIDSERITPAKRSGPPSTIPCWWTARP